MHRDGACRGAVARRASGGRGPSVPLRGRRARAAAPGHPPGSPPARDRPPRHQAGQHPRPVGGPSKARRLRHRIHRGRAGHDHDGPDPRLSRLHVPRAGLRRCRGCPERSVVTRGGAVLRGRRGGAVHQAGTAPDHGRHRERRAPGADAGRIPRPGPHSAPDEGSPGPPRRGQDGRTPPRGPDAEQDGDGRPGCCCPDRSPAPCANTGAVSAPRGPFTETGAVSAPRGPFTETEGIGNPTTPAAADP